MKVELICVGSELLSGKVVNTNAAFISKKLCELGHNSFTQYTVDDDKSRLSDLVKLSLERCNLLIITGGLGPTGDDLTKETVCELLGLELVENQICRKHIDNYFKNLDKKPVETVYKQATAPENAIIFNNDFGTACGIGIKTGEKNIILLPGPPKELTHMFENYVVPYLKTLDHTAIASHSLNVFGIGESSIESILKPLCEEKNPVVATYCGNNECTVSITATAHSQQEAESICSKTMIKIRELLGDFVYGSDSQGLAFEVVNLLRASDMKISVAESCTGGMLSQSLTSISHASEVVEIGITAYSNRIKHEALSVPTEVLENEGAISAKTAMYMAKNVRILSDSDIGVSITGNAGPLTSEDKPVGLVYVAIADKTKFYVKKLTLSQTYDREKIRSYATLTALDLVRRYLSMRPYSLPGMVDFDSDFNFEEDSSSLEAQNIEDVSKFELNPSFIVFESEEYDDEDVPNSYEEAAKRIVQLPDSDVSESEKQKTGFKEKIFAYLKKIGAFFGKILPSKNDKRKDLIIKIISIVSLVCFIVSSVILISYFAHDSIQRTIIQEARDSFDFESEEKDANSDHYSSFAELMAQNSDIKGWISISNTNVNNPVYQTSDNDYYLKHNMQKKKSRYGALFFDCNNKISQIDQSKNLTIYGHNTSDKSMFGTFRYYRNLNFYKQNPIIRLKTLYEQSDYLIFSIMVTNADPKDDNGSIYNFVRDSFTSDVDFLNWISESRIKSLISTGVEVDADDEILTLSTCCYDFDNARLVIMAKKLTSGEPTPDVSSAKLNANVKYPQAWYVKKGLDGYKSDIPSSSGNSSSNTGNVSSNEQTQSNQNSSNTTSSTPTVTDCSHATRGQFTDEGDNHSFICMKCNQRIFVPHNYNLKVKSHIYIKTEATCTKPAIYYMSCKCMSVGTETFEGDLANHTPSGTIKYDDSIHWELCLNTECTAKLNEEEHNYENGPCKCGHAAPASNDSSQPTQ